MPILCYVTDRRDLRLPGSGEALLRKIRDIASADVDWVQIREKDMSARELGSLTRQALDVNRASGTRILVNDRLDVALAENADGVHLPESGLPVREIRRLLQTVPLARELKEDFLIGVSCHSPEAAHAAARDGADYIFFGPIFATPSKAQYGAPQETSRLAEVCGSVNIPVLAIGGITLKNAASCLAAGAAGIAAIRLFQDADNPAGLVRMLRNLLR